MCVVLECGRWWQSSKATHSKPFQQILRSKSTVSVPSSALYLPNIYLLLKIRVFKFALLITNWTYTTKSFSSSQFWGKTDTRNKILLCGQPSLQSQHQSYVCNAFVDLKPGLRSMHMILYWSSQTFILYFKVPVWSGGGWSSLCGIWGYQKGPKQAELSRLSSESVGESILFLTI